MRPSSRKYPVVFDQSAENFDEIYVSGGRVGLTLKVPLKDLLDMESITELNNGLIKFPGVILFTSHDHQFVQTTANRIMEILPNGKLVDKITTYDEYLASDEMAKKRHVFQVNVIPHDLHSDPCFFLWRLWNSCPEAVRKDPDLP